MSTASFSDSAYEEWSTKQVRDDSRRESEGCPTDFEIPLESPFAKVGTDEEVQQDAAGGWGCPPIP